MPDVVKRSSASILAALVAGLVLGALLLGLTGFLLLSRTSGPAMLSQVWSKLTGRTLSIDVSQPTVVDRIHELQRLETVVYTMDKVVSGAKENPIFPDFLAGDRLLMLVHGDVVAGIDFSSLKPGDVQVRASKSTFIFPPRRYSAPGSTAPEHASIPGRPVYWSPPIPTWKHRCVRRQSVSCPQPP